MDFGRIENFQDITYTLGEPVEHRGKHLCNETSLYLGLPLWNHASYLEEFIPPETPKEQYLYFYAQAFNSIELNSTYYSIPSKQRVQGWMQKVEDQDHFTFCPKFPKSLIQNFNQADLRSFLDAIESFHQKLGQVFLQFTPHFDLSYSELFKRILKELPSHMDFGVELRHPSWFSPIMKKRFGDYLAKKDVSWVMTDTPGVREVCHMQLTSSNVFIRFVGNSLDQTDFARIESWCEVIKELIQKKQKIYFFMHQPIEGDGIELVKHMQKLLSEQSHLLVHPYKGYNKKQLSLFE